MAMIAVIFESWPTNAQKYIDMGEALQSHLETLDGFISIERFRSVSDPAKLVALSFWRDEAAVKAWRNNEIHRDIQAKAGRMCFEIIGFGSPQCCETMECSSAITRPKTAA
jgi:heme-degrading monooxygenase HmoA